jgi:hypothetical protein
MSAPRRFIVLFHAFIVASMTTGGLASCALTRDVVEGAAELCGHATYVVTTADVGENSDLLCDRPTGQCATLRAALNTANICRGGGTKTVRLLPGATYEVREADTGHSAFGGRPRRADHLAGYVSLPRVFGSLIVEGEGSSIVRSEDAPEFRLLHVLPDGNLTLRNLTLANGRLSRNANRDLNYPEAGIYGAAIYNEGSVILQATVIQGNRAFGSLDNIAKGGGVYNTGRLLVGQDSRFTNNLATWGSAVYNQGEMEVQRGTFSENGAGSGQGAALYNGSQDARATITAATFSGNVSDSGAIHNSEATLEILQSTFTGNRGVNAAGIYLVRGTITIRRSTFHGEIDAGAINCADTLPHGRLVLSDVTIYRNAHRHPSGIAGLSASGGCTVELSNTIIAGNQPRDCGVSVPSNLMLRGENLVSDGTCGVSRTGDPRLGVLADNGGPTRTHLPQTGSPVIDAGGTVCGDRDQRDQARPVGRCDIGAVERQADDSSR